MRILEFAKRRWWRYVAWGGTVCVVIIARFGVHMSLKFITKCCSISAALATQESEEAVSTLDRFSVLGEIYQRNPLLPFSSDEKIRHQQLRMCDAGASWRQHALLNFARNAHVRADSLQCKQCFLG